MLDEGVWAEVKVGSEELRLFSERNAQGVQISVYNVTRRAGLRLPKRLTTLSRARREQKSTPGST